MKLYHYSHTKIETIDMTKCDGFWMTTIAPTETELLEEIGADGLSFCHVVEFDDAGECLMNSDNHCVEELLKENECDYILNRYEGFDDYATTNPDLVKIIECIEM